MKIFIGRFGHEGNGFSARCLTYEDYVKRGGFVRGKALIEKFTGTRSYLGGILNAAADMNAEVWPSIHIGCAGPALTTECVEKVMNIILEDLSRAVKEGIEGVCFSLHGAGVVKDGPADLEAWVLREFRKVTGDRMPVCVPLDLHGNISPEMAENVALFGIKNNPHTDCWETGYRAMEACIESVRTGRKITSFCLKLPMAVPVSGGCTMYEPFGSIAAETDRITREHHLADLTFFHGFPYSDVPKMGSSVTAAGFEGTDMPGACRELAACIWSKKNAFVPVIRSAPEALDEACSRIRSGYVLINESSDNPGGGAPGDGTHLLRELISRNMEGSLYCYIYDPEAVREAGRYAPGSRIDLSVGGKTEPLHGEPVRLKGAEILGFYDGNYITESPMEKGAERSIGPCVRLKTGNTEIIIGSSLFQVYDDRPMISCGCEMDRYRFVCIKSSNHFKAYFSAHADAMISCDSPGIHSSDLRSFDYKNIARPMFPIDDNVDFTVN